MRSVVSLVLALALVAAASCSSSGPAAVSHPPTIEAFVKAYVASMNNRDLAANRALWHSKSLACISQESSDFYDRAFKISSRHGIPTDYKFSSKPIGPNDKLGFEGYAIFPVRPTLEVQIDYTRGEENSGTVIFWLAQAGNGWTEVFPCATPETLQQFKTKLPEIKTNEEKTKALVDAIQEPLRGEMVAMLRQGKSSTAATRYAEATKQDRATAMYVVEEMEYRLESSQSPK